MTDDIKKNDFRNTFPILNYVTMLHSYQGYLMTNHPDTGKVCIHLNQIESNLSNEDKEFIAEYQHLLPTIENHTTKPFVDYMNEIYPQPKKQKVSLSEIGLKFGKF